ncbi:hypothetical protein N7491_011366 [Penicillium cf. griseofulvum]|nr:hypothetical protein N7491_011366 [Penicillium cf. griseofulvum]
MSTTIFVLNLPIEVFLDIADELKYPETSVLSRTCSNMYGRLNIFLYGHNVHNHNGWGMWRAIKLGSKTALLKFIEQGANPCVMKRMDRSLYYNPYVPYEECADGEDEPGTKKIIDVAQEYEYLHTHGLIWIHAQDHHIGRRRVLSPLYLAVKHQHAEIVRILLDSGVDRKVKSRIYQ